MSHKCEAHNVIFQKPLNPIYQNLFQHLINMKMLYIFCFQNQVYIVHLQHISMRTSHISGVQQLVVRVEILFLYFSGFIICILLPLFHNHFGRHPRKYLNTQGPFTNKNVILFWKKKKKQTRRNMHFLFSLIQK